MGSWGIVAAALFAVQGAEQEDRLKKLEERVEAQQKEIDQLKKSSKQGESGVTGSLTDGLRFRNAGGDIDIHVGGRFQEHYRDTFNRPNSNRTSPDNFFIRAARVKVDGTFFKDYGFQVELDIPNPSPGVAPAALTAGPAATAQAVFVEWKRFKELRLMFGQFKAPMSQERLRSRLFSDFVEDSMLTRFVPGYDIGIQAYGLIEDGLLGYQLAVTNGRSHLDNAGRERNDDNDTKELVGRITVSPFVSDKESILKGLRVGFAGSYTRVETVPISIVATATATANSPTNFDLVTPELGVSMIDPTSNVGAGEAISFDGRRSRLNAEISYAIGPVCARAEYLVRRDIVVNTTAGLRENVPTTAWSATVTWIVTSEEKKPETRIVPTHPFDLQGGWGAVELALRVADARVSNRLGDVNVNLTGNALEVTSYSAGVNWWLTPNVRFSADFVREDYHGKINFGAAGGLHGTLNGFLARMQIDF